MEEYLEKLRNKVKYIQIADEVLVKEGFLLNKKYEVIRIEKDKEDDIYFIVEDENGKQQGLHELVVYEIKE